MSDVVSCLVTGFRFDCLPVEHKEQMPDRTGGCGPCAELNSRSVHDDFVIRTLQMYLFGAEECLNGSIGL